MYRSFYILLTAGFLLLAFSGFRGAGYQDERSGVPDSLFFFKGRILDSLTKDPVAFTHIINTGRNTATICDTLGYFFLRARMKDTLLFSAIGYAPTRIVVGDSMVSLNKIPDVLMHSVSYSIRGVMINPLGSYEAFKRKVAELELPPSRYEINPSVLFEIEQGTDTLDMVPVPAMSPVTALYNWLSKEGKEKRKLAKLIEKERFEREVGYKYSPLIVSGITGYSGFELYSFMDFCSFKRKFLQETDRYEIHDAVVEKQRSFESIKEEELEHLPGGTPEKK